MWESRNLQEILGAIGGTSGLTTLSISTRLDKRVPIWLIVTTYSQICTINDMLYRSSCLPVCISDNDLSHAVLRENVLFLPDHEHYRNTFDTSRDITLI